MLVRLEHQANAEEPTASPEVIITVCNLSVGIYEMARAGQVTLVKLEQPEKAQAPILVTLSGMVKLVKFEQK